MTQLKLAETALYQLELFFVLMEIDEAYRIKDENLTNLMDKIYQNRKANWRKMFPLLRINTTLSLLMGPLAMISSLNDDELAELDMKIQKYSITYNGKINNIKISEIFTTLRNAVIHMFESIKIDEKEYPNISFDKGILCCRDRHKPKYNELVFSTEEGFINLIKDIRKAIHSVTTKWIKNQNND